MAVGRSNELARRLASRVTAAHFQPKLDGWRVIADVQTGRMYTRSEKELPSTPGLEHIRDALLSNQPASNRFRYVDGELMHDGGRERIQGSINNDSTGGGLSLHLFDCVLETECFSRRHEALQEWLTRAAQGALQLVPTRRGEVGSVADALEALQEVGLGFQKDDFEGAVLRLDDVLADGGGYTIAGGRSLNALKWKVREDDEFEILYLNEQKPKGSGMLGSVKCSRNGAGRSKYFTALVDGERWSDDTLKEVWEQRALYSVKHVGEEDRGGFEPQWKAMVEHNGIDETGKPVAGRLVGFRHRDDLPPV